MIYCNQSYVNVAALRISYCMVLTLPVVPWNGAVGVMRRRELSDLGERLEVSVALLRAACRSLTKH